MRRRLRVLAFVVSRKDIDHVVFGATIKPSAVLLSKHLRGVRLLEECTAAGELRLGLLQTCFVDVDTKRIGEKDKAADTVAGRCHPRQATVLLRLQRRFPTAMPARSCARSRCIFHKGEPSFAIERFMWKDERLPESNEAGFSPSIAL